MSGFMPEGGSVSLLVLQRHTSCETEIYQEWAVGKNSLQPYNNLFFNSMNFLGVQYQAWINNNKHSVPTQSPGKSKQM